MLKGYEMGGISISTHMWTYEYMAFSEASNEFSPKSNLPVLLKFRGAGERLTLHKHFEGTY